MPEARNLSNMERGKRIAIGYFKHDIIDGGSEKCLYIIFLHSENSTICAKIYN